MIPKSALLSLIAMVGVLGTASSAAAVEQVQDGGFEATTCPTDVASCTDEPFWTESGTEAFVCHVGTCGNGAATGSAWGMLAGRASLGSASGTFTQLLLIPDSPATLSFNLRIAEGAGAQSTAFQVVIDPGTPDVLSVFSAGQSTAGYSTYAPVSRDVSAATGPGTHRLQFFVSCSGSAVLCARFDVDDVSLTTRNPAASQGSATPGAQLTCQGEPVTIAGTPRGDELAGTSGRDVIASRDGEDKVLGLGGNDLICGGDGKDTLKGGQGRDTLLGQSGADTHTGGGGNDTCRGGKNDDSAKGCEVEKSI